MADIQISVDAGTQTRLLTAGKYCESDIIVTAGSGGGDNWADVISGMTDTYIDRQTAALIQNAFNGSQILANVAMLALQSTEINAFRQSKIVRLYAPMLTGIPNAGMASCSRLEYVALLGGGSITGTALDGCAQLSALVILGSEQTSLGSATALDDTLIGSGAGYIYVPDDLVEQYKVATNWASYASQIKGLSEVPADVQQWLDQQGGAAA